MFPRQSTGGGGGGMAMTPISLAPNFNTGMGPQRQRSARGMPMESMPSYKRGGKVKKTGPAKLHKGERVLTKRQAGKVRVKSKSKAR